MLFSRCRTCGTWIDTNARICTTFGTLIGLNMRSSAEPASEVLSFSAALLGAFVEFLVLKWLAALL